MLDSVIGSDDAMPKTTDFTNRADRIDAPTPRAIAITDSDEASRSTIARIWREIAPRAMEITSFERNRTYTISHRKAGVQMAATFWFEPVDEGTKVSIEFELERGGLPPGFLAPLGWAIEGKVKQMLGHDLADLKHAIEG